MYWGVVLGRNVVLTAMGAWTISRVGNDKLTSAFRSARTDRRLWIVRMSQGARDITYRAPDKNAKRPFATCLLANLFMACRHVLRVT